MGALLLGACGGDAASPDAPGVADLASISDMAGTTDLALGPCAQLGVWPTDQVSSQAESKMSGTFDWRTILRANRPHGPDHVDRLRIELYHPTGATTPLPHTTTIPAEGHYGTCTECVLIDLDLDPATGTLDRSFFARAGTLTVTRADRTPGHGTTALRGEHLRFDEWRYDPATGYDEALPGGRCLEVERFELSSDYALDAPDGGP